MRRSSSKHEIERKFLVRALPEGIHLSSLPRREIAQSYLIVTENKEELRIRQEGDSHFLTLKYGEGLVRAQPEIQLTREQFDALWDSEGNRKVWKTRYFVHLGKMEVHLDVYNGKLDGLVTAEVEFKSRQEARRFHLPLSWADRMTEITRSSEYRNSALALLDGYNGPKVTVQSEFEKGFQRLVKGVDALLSGNKDHIVVGVAGGSASGKTSMVSTKLKERLGDSAVRISMDDYYRGAMFVKEFGLNFDQPDAVDLDLFLEHLQALKVGTTIDKPVYDFKTGARIDRTEKVFPRRVIIVEGLFALNEKIRGALDLSVFVDVGAHGRVIRRLKSDSERTALTPFETLRDITKIVEPMYVKYVLPTKTFADLVIKNEYDPRSEAKSTGVSQSQIKYELIGVIGTEELLRKTGAVSVAKVRQVDRYFTPSGGSFAESDEMLRIREEGGRRLFTYKGPRSEGDDAIKRQVFSFEVDDETNSMLSSIYQVQPAVVLKDRSVYYYNGLLFTFDDVALGQLVGTGTSIEHKGYLEFTIYDAAGRRQMNQLVTKLGMDPEKRLLKPYWEILA